MHLEDLKRKLDFHFFYLGIFIVTIPLRVEKTLRCSNASSKHYLEGINPCPVTPSSSLKPAHLEIQH